ncbi:spore germination protein [Bacillus sp. ISL-47]|uniref:spore germination protein n=1 Tax=Bacillus sp. ISL-47 TaxID=2819130 RepID=UPI001BE5A226|nr:spore germination protein [Bacillus sp. ISL-47]MBT2688216.1 spore germination protein [Bacillus sp. ISL-47]MBT2710010.1 spore germination protein [Pseudomonas sp. ISL-84]
MFKKKNQIADIKALFKKEIGHTMDAVFQDLEIEGQKVLLVYLSSICDTEKIQSDLVKPFFEISQTDQFAQYLQSLNGVKEYAEFDQALKEVMRGSVLILFVHAAYTVNFKNYISQGVQDASVETTIQGPQTALSEDLGTNLNIIRHRYHQPSLTVEKNEIGSVSGLEMHLLYDAKKVDPEVLGNLREKIEEIKYSNEIIQSAGEFHRLLTPNKRSLFPVFMITERTDRIALNLSQGKIVLLMEGSPFALILPAVFYDFMSSMEDFYQPYWVGKFLHGLRYFGLLISLILPGLYVALASYNPEVFQIQLALGIAGSRSSVPYPTYLEVLFMLLMMELLTEASIRLPKTIGSTATTVGGLILGQAATEAGLVSNIMIILVSAVAISNFVIPINEMSFSMRIVKYLILFISTLTGMIGLIVGLMGLVVYLVSLDSFGHPYLRVFLGESKDGKQGAAK